MKNTPTLFIIQNRHNGDNVIENVLNYVISSPFAELDEAMAHGLTMDYYQMINEFYQVQEPYRELEKHRRIFHMVLSMRPCNNMQKILNEGAENFLNYMALNGHQVLLVPHYGSKGNAYNYHWHAVVNVKSYSSGDTLYDKYATYKKICDYLIECQGIQWDYKYHKDKRVVASQYF